MTTTSRWAGVLAAASLLLGACAPTAQPTSEVQTIVVTQVVAGTPVERVITATPEPTADRSAEPVSLRFTTWTGNEAQLAVLNAIGADYTALHPNVTVQFETIPFDEYPTKLSVQLAGGDPPDLGWIVEVVAANWIEAGVFEDVSDTLQAYPGYDYDDLLTAPLSLWARDESLYAVPFSTSPFFVLYNKDLFAAAGLETPDALLARGEWTYAAFADAAKAIAEQGGAGVYGYLGVEGGNMYAANLWQTLTPFLWAYGAEPWSADYATCGLNTPEAIEAVSLVQRMVVTDESTVPPGETASFTSGQIGMAFGQLSRIGALKDATFEWGIAPLPGGPAGARPTIGQAAIAVFRQGAHSDLAADFLAFMTTEANVARLAQFWPPIRQSVLDSGVIAQNYPAVDAASLDAAVVAGIANGNVVPSHPDFAKLDLALRPSFDQLWAEGADVQTLMNQACESGATFFKP